MFRVLCLYPPRQTHNNKYNACLTSFPQPLPRFTSWDITEKVEGRWRPVLVPRGLQVLPPCDEPISVFHWLKRRYYFLLFTFDPLRDLLGSQLGRKVLFPEINI